MFGNVGNNINSNASNANTIGKCLIDVELTEFINNRYV